MKRSTDRILTTHAGRLQGPPELNAMQRNLRESHCLIVRPPLAPAAAEGELVPILPLDF